MNRVYNKLRNIEATYSVAVNGGTAGANSAYDLGVAIPAGAVITNVTVRCTAQSTGTTANTMMMLQVGTTLAHASNVDISTTCWDTAVTTGGVFNVTAPKVIATAGTLRFAVKGTATTNDIGAADLTFYVTYAI
jgi:hypothetical protein